jgi:hypothetical protein
MMRRLLDEIRESYNFILIDSPPAIAVSDAAILSVFADGVLLVLHAKRTTAAAARQALERLDSVRATFLGVVLNGIDLGNPDYSYYRQYYGGHYTDGTNPPKNGTHRTDATTAQGGLDETGERFEKMGSGTLSPEFFDHLITKFNEAVDLQERVDKISAILRSKGKFRPTMSEGRTEEANNGSHRTNDLNIKDKLQQANKGFREFGSETISRQSLNHLIVAFSKAVGPMAYLIVRDEAVRLGESVDSFPKNRLKELVDNISTEIVND